MDFPIHCCEINYSQPTNLVFKSFNRQKKHLLKISISTPSNSSTNDDDKTLI